MYGISKAECDFKMKYYLIIIFFIDDYFLCTLYLLHGAHCRSHHIPTDSVPCIRHIYTSFKTLTRSVVVPRRENSCSGLSKKPQALDAQKPGS